MFLTLGFENKKFQTLWSKDSLGFCVNSGTRVVRSRLVHLGAFHINRDSPKPTLGQFIFAHLVCHLKISLTSLLKPGSPSLGVGSAHIARTYDGIVPRLFLVIDNDPSNMV